MPCAIISLGATTDIRGPKEQLLAISPGPTGLSIHDRPGRCRAASAGGGNNIQFHAGAGWRRAVNGSFNAQPGQE